MLVRLPKKFKVHKNSNDYLRTMVLMKVDKVYYEPFVNNDDKKYLLLKLLNKNECIIIKGAYDDKSIMDCIIKSLYEYSNVDLNCIEEMSENIDSINVFLSHYEDPLLEEFTLDNIGIL